MYNRDQNLNQILPVSSTVVHHVLMLFNLLSFQVKAVNSAGGGPLSSPINLSKMNKSLSVTTFTIYVTQNGLNVYQLHVQVRYQVDNQTPCAGMDCSKCITFNTTYM